MPLFSVDIGEQWPHSRSGNDRAELQVRLLVAVRVLLSPQLQQEWRHFGQYCKRSVHSGCVLMVAGLALIAKF